MGAEVSIAEPIKACSSLANTEELKHRIAVIERGECMFIDKVRRNIQYLVIHNGSTCYLEYWKMRYSLHSQCVSVHCSLCTSGMNRSKYWH